MTRAFGNQRRKRALPDLPWIAAGDMGGRRLVQEQPVLAKARAVGVVEVPGGWRRIRSGKRRHIRDQRVVRPGDLGRKQVAHTPAAGQPRRHLAPGHRHQRRQRRDALLGPGPEGGQKRPDAARIGGQRRVREKRPQGKGPRAGSPSIPCQRSRISRSTSIRVQPASS